MRLIVPRIRFFSCGSKIWFLLSYQSMLVVLSFWAENVLKNAIGVSKHRKQDSVSKNLHTSALFVLMLFFLLSWTWNCPMYRIACFFKGSLKCDLSIQKSFCGYVEVSSDFLQHSRDRFGGIWRTVWDFTSQGNQLFEWENWSKFWKFDGSSKFMWRVGFYFGEFEARRWLCRAPNCPLCTESRVFLKGL